MARILLIDDDDRLREAMWEVLTGEGHELAEASDGIAALNVHRRHPADLIICDMFMPKQDGIETLQMFRQQFPAVRIIAVSGGGYSGALDVLTMARHMGASAVLTKPFRLGQLLAVVEQQLSEANTGLSARSEDAASGK